MKLRLVLAAGMACLMALFTQGVIASPMTTTANAEVRDGNNNVIGRLPSGTAVDMNMCSGQYCLVSGGGLRGWVLQSQLAAAQGNPPPQQNNPRPGGGNQGGGFPFDFNFSFGNQPPYHRPPPNFPPPNNFPDRRAEVCFFERPNFRGDSFCVRRGDRDSSLSRRWNDGISSISVGRGITALVCSDNRMRGACAEISRDVSRLPRSLDGRISSYEVY